MKKLLLAVGIAVLVVGCGDKSGSKESKEAANPSDQKLYSYFIKCYPPMALEAEVHKNTGMGDAQMLADTASAFRLAAFSSGEKIGLSMAKVDAELLSGYTTMRQPIADLDSKSPAEQAEISASFKKISGECSATLEGDPEIVAALKRAYEKAK